MHEEDTHARVGFKRAEFAPLIRIPALNRERSAKAAETAAHVSIGTGGKRPLNSRLFPHPYIILVTHLGQAMKADGPKLS